MGEAIQQFEHLEASPVGIRLVEGAFAQTALRHHQGAGQGIVVDGLQQILARGKGFGVVIHQGAYLMGKGEIQRAITPRYQRGQVRQVGFQRRQQRRKGWRERAYFLIINRG